MKSIKSLIVTATMVVLSASAVASADWTPYAGTPGPHPFAFYTPNGIAMHGVAVRVGDAITAIAAIWGTWNNRSNWYGGTGGQEIGLLCPWGRMKGINAEWGIVVDAVQVACLESGGRGWSYSGWAGWQGENSSSLRCASGYWVQGMKGETGDAVDRVSMFCAR